MFINPFDLICMDCLFRLEKRIKKNVLFFFISLNLQKPKKEAKEKLNHRIPKVRQSFILHFII